MSNNSIIAAVLGGITSFFLGFIFYAVLLMDFFKANAGSATGVARTDDMVWWALVAGNFALGFFFAWLFSTWAGISTFKGGLEGGATVGLFMGLFYNLIGYATANVMNLTASLVDVVVAMLMFGITGAVVAWYLGRGK